MALVPRHLWSGAALAASLCWGSSARAQPAPLRCPEARAAIELALREREANHTAAALAVLEDLHARCATPQVVAQLALAESDAGRLLPAWRHLQEALAAESDPWIRSRRAALVVARTELRARLASLVVRGAPPGASLHLDGERLGEAAAEPYLVAPGTLRVEVRSPGFRTEQREAVAAAGQSVVLDVTLTPDAPAPVVSPPTVSPPVVVAPPPRANPPSASAGRLVGYALLGVGAAAAATGAVFAVLTVTGASALEGATATSPGGEGAFVRFVTSPSYTATDRSTDTACAAAATSGSADGRAAAELCASHDRARVLAWALGLGGVALAGIGAGLAIARPGERRTASWRVAPAVGEVSGVWVHGTF